MDSERASVIRNLERFKYDNYRLGYGYRCYSWSYSCCTSTQVQKFIEKWNEKRGRKLWIFKTLMATRGTVLSPQHVQALNMIDLEFSSNNSSEKAVLDAWKLYLNHLGDAPKDYKDSNYQTAFTLWCAKSNDCLVDLLYQMSQSAGYHFDRVQLLKGAYAPQGHADVEFEISLMRKGLLDVLYGRRPLPVEPHEPPPGRN